MLVSSVEKSPLFTEITNQQSSVISGGDSVIIVYDRETNTISSQYSSKGTYSLGGIYYTSKLTFAAKL